MNRTVLCDPLFPEREKLNYTESECVALFSERVRS